MAFLFSNPDFQQGEGSRRLKCSVVRCENEVYEEGVCESCLELLGKKDEYVPLICWKCGTVIDVFHKTGSYDSIFSVGCRKCSEVESEKDTFIVKSN